MKPHIGILALLLLASAAWPAAAAPALPDTSVCLEAKGDDAIAACSRLIESKPVTGRNLALAYGARGTHFQQRGEHDRAIADFNEALRLEPDHAQAIVNRAEALSKQTAAVANTAAAPRVNKIGVVQ